MTTNTEQKYRFFGAADKAPTQFKRVVELCGRNNGGLSILLQFIPVFLFVFFEALHINFEKEAPKPCRQISLFIYIYFWCCVPTLG